MQDQEDNLTHKFINGATIGLIIVLLTIGGVIAVFLFKQHILWSG